MLHWAYYYVGGLSSNGWRVHKLDTSVDNIVHYGNAVYLENDYFRGQTLCPTNNGYFTTTKDQPPVIFVIDQALTATDTAVVETEATESVTS